MPYVSYPTPPLIVDGNPVETIAIIGYGNQGRAQALNLRDNGLPVTVGLKEKSASRVRAAADGFKVKGIAKAASDASAIFLLAPDEHLHHAAETVMKNAGSGAILILAHGSSLYFKKWEPSKKFDCGLIAPHGPGVEFRRIFEQGGGLPAMVAVIRDSTGRCRERVELLSAAIGCARDGAGIRWTTLKEEVEVDLFVEQTLLVGGLIELTRAVIATLIRAGYDPAVARMSTVAEIGNMASIYNKFGAVDSFREISGTAAFGAATRGPRLIDSHTRRVLEDILEEISSGKFQDELLSPEAPLILNQYIDGLEQSHLADADRLFHPKKESQVKDP